MKSGLKSKLTRQSTYDIDTAQHYRRSREQDSNRTKLPSFQRLEDALNDMRVSKTPLETIEEDQPSQFPSRYLAYRSEASQRPLRVRIIQGLIKNTVNDATTRKSDATSMERSTPSCYHEVKLIALDDGNNAYAVFPSRVKVARVA